MNRLFHLRQTLPRNIEHASSYPDAEFVLLDYGSTDGLEDWVRSELSDHIKSGRLIFYRTDEPKHWIAAHAKNIAHKMASGDILFNIDSDILIPDGFCEYARDAFSLKPDMVMAFESADSYGNDGCAGIVATKREYFYSVNGYDEAIRLGWGYDDMNYQFRVRMKNNLYLFTPPKFCLCIPHSNEIRTENCQLKHIETTRDMSMSICNDVANRQDYVANKSIDWGSAKLTKNFNDTLQA
jgi:glycosyltransferase involved in cell wall biosynthesis